MIKVTKPFKGVRDGETRTRLFEEGDELKGKLAQVAIEQGWAEETEETVDASSEQSGADSGANETGEGGTQTKPGPADTQSTPKAKKTSRKATAKKKS